MLVMGILGIGIDGAIVLLSLIEEVELDDALMTVLITFTANKPVVGAFGFTSYRDIVGRLCFQLFRIIPVTGHILDELEGIHIFGIVLRKIGSHL